eukprot:UN23894
MPIEEASLNFSFILLAYLPENFDQFGNHYRKGLTQVFFYSFC